MANVNLDNSNAALEWLNSCKQSVRWQYANRWAIWLEYCRAKGLPSTGSEQLEDMKKRRLPNNNTSSKQQIN